MFEESFSSSSSVSSPYTDYISYSPRKGKRSSPFTEVTVRKRVNRGLFQMADNVDIVMGDRRRRWPRSVLRRSGVRKYRGRVRRRGRRPYRVGGWANPARAELKFKDTTLTGNTSTTAAYYLLNGIAPGTGPSSIIGRKIVMKSIELNWQSAVDAAGSDQIHRIMLVYDKQPNSVALTLAELLGAGADTMIHKNLDNRQRFTVLMDRKIELNAAAEPNSHVYSKFFKKFRLPATYNATGDATISSISTGSLYLCTIGNIALGLNDGTISGYARLRYTDV